MLFRRHAEKLAVVNPCREDWDAMAGDARDRFCASCNRTVHNLSLLTPRQAADLLNQSAGKICGRIHYDEHGNQIFAKQRSPIERLIQISIVGISAAAAAGAAPACDVKVRVVDPAGAVVPEAAVRIAKAGDTEAVSSGTSNDRGEFSGQVASGTYSLRVQSPGFLSGEQQLTCKKSETVSVEAPLQVASMMGEVIMVTSDRHPLLRKLRSFFHRL